ncbi:MAG TPA: 30S ribosomal protein S7 [Phycisphaerae bacterium]|nr:30S ribosomal protein S7 [Phycisphaerae bacterium]
MAYKKWTAGHTHLKRDPRFGSDLVQKFVNSMMWDGKKATAQRAFYRAMDIIADRVKDAEPLDVFTQAVENVKPRIEVRSKRVGGATYQVPMQVNEKRRLGLATRWILQAVRGRSGKPVADRLAEELVAAYRREGTAIQTRENIHRMAEANKAFAHFAW